jgi:hypothetical protein
MNFKYPQYLCLIEKQFNKFFYRISSKPAISYKNYSGWLSSPKFFKIFFGVPHSATCMFIIFLYVIASIAYIHPVYGAGVQTHNLLIVSHLP